MDKNREPRDDRLAETDDEQIVTIDLVVEIMGRRSNVILVDQAGRMMEAVKRVTPDMSRVRPILPGTHTYRRQRKPSLISEPSRASRSPSSVVPLRKARSWPRCCWPTWRPSVRKWPVRSFFALLETSSTSFPAR